MNDPTNKYELEREFRDDRDRHDKDLATQSGLRLLALGLKLRERRRKAGVVKLQA